jgi:hypothetical protein
MMISWQENMGGWLNAQQKNHHYHIRYGKALADELYKNTWHFDG